MAKEQMNLRGVLTIIVLWCSTFVSGTPITRIDVYDSGDNHLLFVILNIMLQECVLREIFFQVTAHFCIVRRFLAVLRLSRLKKFQ